MDTQNQSLVARLWAKVTILGPDDCWLWTGCKSKSGQRQVVYGCIREGRAGSRLWRVNRLICCLTLGIVEVPPDDDEQFLDWLHRVNRWYDTQDAAHQCDNSLCRNPRHLLWETHLENIRRQKARKIAARLKAVA